jgi:hypothetical protein
MFKGMNLGGLMKKAQKMQSEMLKIQEELAKRVVEGTAGGGMVKVQVNGAREALSVRIDPQAVDPGDIEMLEDLVLAAVKEAMRKADELAKSEMAKITGGMDLPGLM